MCREYSNPMEFRRRELLKGLNLGPAAVFPALAMPSGAPAAAASPSHIRGIANGTAIQGVCAWPNLQILDDGTILAMIFNQPCHGLWEGDLDCWASEDQGGTWRFRGRVAEHEPGTNRMNCAAGVAANGDVVVLCSGWADRRRRGEPVARHQRPLRSWVCRSSDQGLTWSVEGGFPAPPPSEIGNGNELIPFGNIRVADDSALCVAAYLRKADSRICYLLRSRDDGRAWGEAVTLHPGGNETDILHLGSGRWLAACREFRERRDVHLELFSSIDDGRNWSRAMPLTLPRQVTGHLVRLADGRILPQLRQQVLEQFRRGRTDQRRRGHDMEPADSDRQLPSPRLRIPKYRAAPERHGSYRLLHSGLGGFPL